MFSFIKKLLGLPTDEEKKQATEAKVEIAYKIEAPQPVVNNKSGDVIELPKQVTSVSIVEEVVVKPVEPTKDIKQVKDVETVKEVKPPVLEVVKNAVEEKPVKKTRKPAKPKVEKEKGAEKSAPEKVKKSKSKKT